jgi:hypothetical protein
LVNTISGSWFLIPATVPLKQLCSLLGSRNRRRMYVTVLVKNCIRRTWSTTWARSSIVSSCSRSQSSSPMRYTCAQLVQFIEHCTSTFKITSQQAETIILFLLHSTHSYINTAWPCMYAVYVAYANIVDLPSLYVA